MGPGDGPSMLRFYKAGRQFRSWAITVTIDPILYAGRKHGSATTDSISVDYPHLIMYYVSLCTDRPYANCGSMALDVLAGRFKYYRWRSCKLRRVCLSSCIWKVGAPGISRFIG